MAQHIINIPITKSAYCDKLTPNSTYKENKVIAAADRHKAALAWVVEGIPARKRIVSTKLYLYVINNLSSAGYGGAKYSIDYFNEDNFTWNNALYQGNSVSISLSSGLNSIELGDPDVSSIIISGDYTQYAYGWFEIASHRAASNNPYIVITYEDVPPNAPYLKSPVNVTVNNKSVIRFSWNYRSDVGGTQKAFDFEYSLDGGTTWSDTISQTTSNTYYDLPANTLPRQTVMWRVRTYNEYDEVGPYATATFTTGATPPAKPTLIDPIGEYKDNQSVLRFTWKYNSTTGGVQKAFDFQWSTNGTTWNTVSETTSNSFYDMPAGTLPGGNIYWRVRTYNEHDELGEYSDAAAFYCIGASSAPIIENITDTARPVISWVAPEQQVYQLQIAKNNDVVYVSGNIPSILFKEHKVKAFLDDGTYTVRVKVKNEYDIWSDWGELDFEIATVKPSKPSFSIYNTNYGLQLHILPVEDAAYYLIYRSEYNKDNYICIGRIEKTTFDDNTVANNRDYKYFVRAVTADEAYQDSNVKVGTAYFKHSLIAPITDLNNILVLKHGFNRKPARSLSRIQKGEVSYFNGRKHGVAEFSEHIESGITLEFAFKTYNEVEQFLEIYDLGETVLYRDSKGRKIYGTMNGLHEREEQAVYIISFTISETDYTEEVDI